VPASLNYNVTGWLVYDNTKSLPDPASVNSFDPFDDFALVPYDKQELLPEPDQTVELTVIMANLGDGAN
jgi:iron transport multicopper oxidase